MATFRRFTSGDYLGYDGAENLPDDTPPLISTDTDPWVTYLITGNEGRTSDGDVYSIAAHIFEEIEEGEEKEEWWFRETPNADVAKRIGSLLPRDGDRTTLLALGFSRSI